jgi:type III pantothenate kinase
LLLCIDSGNTRLKWGVHDGQGWRQRGALQQAEVSQLAAQLHAFPELQDVAISHVAGETVAAGLEAALAALGLNGRFLASSPEAAGVRNGYREPERLGVDRWCALVGARGLCPGAVLVVSAGTATTIDSLDAEGRFLGGLILPGFDLMRGALARGTAQLPLAAADYNPWPGHTQQAIVSGCIEAQVGAIERAYRRLAALAGETRCLLTGGAAPYLIDALAVPHEQRDDLVLEGVRRLAAWSATEN